MNETYGPVEGGCLCGAVRYSLSQPPHNAGYCHCRMCQRALGNLFGAWIMTKNEYLRYPKNEPNWYSASDTARRGFCGECGSPIIWQPEGKDFAAIWIGTLDDPTAYVPQGHWHTEGKIPWVDIHGDLPVRS